MRDLLVQNDIKTEHVCFWNHEYSVIQVRGNILTVPISKFVEDPKVVRNILSVVSNLIYN